MSDLANFKFDALRATDEPKVSLWLLEHLVRHLQWWSSEMGPAWSASRVESHIVEHQLVQKEWAEMWEDGQLDGHFVTVARAQAGEPVGLIWGSIHKDRYFRDLRGVVHWLSVAPNERRRGIAARLMDWSDIWFKGKGARSRELFVTAANSSAVELYKKNGYRTVDVRMLHGQ